ncbi:MAG: hypothetical protein EOP34_02070 [Rickettsiales bacterium]|nr:MAG: hypothetical protein EOP34_02070 [Rickettsiales bacterium]
MPALLGGFGEKFSPLINNKPKQTLDVEIEKSPKNPRLAPVFYIQKKNYSSLSSSKLKMDQSNTEKINLLGSYLAGLIEGDGTIAVHENIILKNKHCPKIIIVFHKNDTPLANHLRDSLNVGTIYKPTGPNHVLWQIQDLLGVIKIINIINGYMRTPKIEALDRAINWINAEIVSQTTKSCKNKTPSQFLGVVLQTIKLKPLNNSPLDSDSWLAGFSDADGSFNITIAKRKKEGRIGHWRVTTRFSIELRQTYHREVRQALATTVSYETVLLKVATLLKVNLYSRTRIMAKTNNIVNSYTVMSFNQVSNEILRNYFNTFPLFSSKHLAFQDWCKVQDICKREKQEKLDNISLDSCQKIKDNFNTKRNYFTWSHLVNFYC